MGCDIHIVVERKKKFTSKWIGVYLLDDVPGPRPTIGRRDYEFFARVAGVRGSVPETIYPKNIPEDVSELAWQQYMLAPTDYHSASFMPAEQFANAWCAVNADNLGTVRPQYCATDLLGSVDREEFDYRVVFWFDN